MLERMHTAARDGGLCQQRAGAVRCCARAHGACFTDARCSKLRPIIGLDARQHGSAARCMPPPPPAHSPRVPQAAAAARVAGKDSMCDAARKGDVSLVGDHILADDQSVNTKDSGYDPPLHARLKMGAQVLFRFGRFNSLVLVVDPLRSICLPLEVTSRLVDCSWKRKLTWGPKSNPSSWGSPETATVVAG